MNPFRELAIWIVGLLPPDAPSWAVGAAVCGAIIIPPLLGLALVGIIASKVEKIP